MIEAPEPLPTSKPGDPRYPGTNQSRIIIDLVKKMKSPVGAEIGVLKGKTSSLLLAGLPHLTLYCVDQWKQLPKNSADGSETYERFDMSGCEQSTRLIARFYGDRMHVIKAESTEAALTFPDGFFDFVFIDASHTSEAVAADIKAWGPKVRETGIIIGHDWWFPSVRKVLDSMLPGWVRHHESVWSISAREFQCLSM